MSNYVTCCLCGIVFDAVCADRLDGHPVCGDCLKVAREKPRHAIFWRTLSEAEIRCDYGRATKDEKWLEHLEALHASARAAGRREERARVIDLTRQHYCPESDSHDREFLRRVEEGRPSR